MTELLSPFRIEPVWREPIVFSEIPKPAIACGDAADWAAARLGFEPDGVQRDLLSAGGRRLILNCTRQWGKSTVTAAKAVHTAYFQERSLTLVVSPSARQSGEFVRKAAEFLRRLGIRPKGDGDNEISLALPNGSRIVGLPGMDGTIRGFSASLLLIDEASRVSDDLYHAVTPMLAVRNGDLWMMSTPCGKRGFFYEVWSKGGPEWKKVRVTAEECGRIPASFLVEERAGMGERCFRQEYLCEFSDVETALFDRDLIMGAIRSDVRPLWG
jgi:hypothetical protein